MNYMQTVRGRVVTTEGAIRYTSEGGIFISEGGIIPFVDYMQTVGGRRI